MRVPGSVWRGFQAGLGGTTLVMAIGCSRAPAPTEGAPTPSEAAQGWNAKGTDEKASERADERDGRSAPGWRDDRTASRDDASRRDDAQPRDDRQVPGNAWFLQSPSDPNQPASVTPGQSETPRPIVVVPAQPIQQPVVHQPVVHQPRPRGWQGIRAACGRG